ncbi:MAG: hypothetical protein AAFO07_11255, partial [Bacteroidota bacterium]
ILINLSLISHLHAEYLTSVADACLRIGPVSDNLECYDLMIDLLKDQNLNDFINQVELLLGKTNNTHESTQI